MYTLNTTALQNFFDNKSAIPEAILNFLNASCLFRLGTMNGSCDFDPSKANMSSNYEHKQLSDYTIYFEHPEEMLEPWNINPYFIPIIATYIITFIVGVTGNVTVISVMLGDRQSSNVTSVFLVSLAISDLLLLVICAPLDVGHYFVLQWDSEGTICKLAAYAETISAFASVLNLVAVTLERFVVIVFPIRSRSLCTMTNCRRLMICVWWFSVILASPIIATKNTVETTYTNYDVSVTIFSCKDLSDWRGISVSIYRLVTLFVLPSILMIACYAWVIVELWVSTKTMDELTNTTSDSNLRRCASRASISHENPLINDSHRHTQRNQAASDVRDVKKARQQVIKMLIFVVILFLVCWGPRLIMDITLKCCISIFDYHTYRLRLISYVLPFVHSCLNPIVYSFMSTKFRNRLIRAFQRTGVSSALCEFCCRKETTMHRPMLLKNSVSRNGTSRIGSTYTFNSYTPSSMCSPPAELTNQTLDV